MIVRGDKFIILRYSNGIYDCIKNHKAVIDERGYCWFGKIGAVPSERALKEKLNPENPLAVLYCSGNAFISQLLGISHEKPVEGYPAYYQKFMYDRNIYPKMYFKLGSLEEFPHKIFAKCVSLSSKRPLVESVTKSMASCFYGEYPLEDYSTSLSDSILKKKNTTKK